MTLNMINEDLAFVLGYPREDIRSSREDDVFVLVRCQSTGSISRIEKFGVYYISSIYSAPGFQAVKKIWDKAFWKASWTFHENSGGYAHYVYVRCALTVIKAYNGGSLWKEMFEWYMDFEKLL